MPLFMMVSGYLCGKAVKVGSFADYGWMLKKRAVGYLLPFFAWTLVFHLDDFTWAFPAYLEQPERGLWFLITLFVLTFMVYTAQLAEALLGGGRKGKVAFWLVYGALTVLVLLEARAGIPWLGPHLTKIYLPFYMAAYLWGEYQPLHHSCIFAGALEKTGERHCHRGRNLLHRGGGGHGSDGDERHPGLRATELGFFWRLHFGHCIFLPAPGRQVQAIPGLAGTVHAGDLFHSLSFCPDFKSGDTGFCCIQSALAGICGGKLLRYECVDGAGGCGVPIF